MKVKIFIVSVFLLLFFSANIYAFFSIEGKLPTLPEYNGTKINLQEIINQKNSVKMQSAIITPIFMEALAWRESNNNYAAESDCGARGLYQITWIAWEDVQINASKIREWLGVDFRYEDYDYTDENVEDTKINEKFARAYLELIINHYLPNASASVTLENILACYNYGFRRVRDIANFNFDELPNETQVFILDIKEKILNEEKFQKYHELFKQKGFIIE